MTLSNARFSSAVEVPLTGKAAVLALESAVQKLE